MLDSSYGITIDFTPMIYPWLSFKIMILITKVTKDTGSRGMTSWGSRDSSAQIPQGIIWILQAGQVLSTCSWSPTGKYPGATAMTSSCSAPRTGSSWRNTSHSEDRRCVSRRVSRQVEPIYTKILVTILSEACPPLPEDRRCVSRRVSRQVEVPGLTSPSGGGHRWGELTSES